MSNVIDLQKRRHALQSVQHPAGVSLPLETPGQAALLTPRIRQELASGWPGAELVRGLRTALRAGERILVLGSGFGVLSTLIARARGIDQLIVIEPDHQLARYLARVHRANAVPWVEVVNGVPSPGGLRRVPLFVREDVRTSSLTPSDGPWQEIRLVPAVDLELVLGEEQISLIVAESAASATPLLAAAGLGPVERLLLGAGSATGGAADPDELAACLAARGFRAARQAGVLWLGRPAGRKAPRARAASA